MHQKEPYRMVRVSEKNRWNTHRIVWLGLAGFLLSTGLGFSLNRTTHSHTGRHDGESSKKVSKEGFVTLGKRKIWYRIEGEGEPLLLVPGGGGGSHHYFIPYFKELSKQFKVVYFDSFGRGLSGRAASVDEYSFEKDLEDIEGLRSSLKLGPINILGHSFSGLTVQAYAMKYPTSVKKLILMNPLVSGPAYQELTDRFNQQIADLFPDLDEKVREIRGRGHKSSHPEHQAAYFEQFNDILTYFYWYNRATAPPLPFDSLTFNTEVYYKLVGEDADFVVGGDVRNLDYQKKLSEIRNPILVLAGRFDQVVFPRQVVDFKKSVPSIQLVFMERSAHYPFIEETERTMELIWTFLSQ